MNRATGNLPPRRRRAAQGSAVLLMGLASLTACKGYTSSAASPSCAMQESISPTISPATRYASAEQLGLAILKMYSGVQADKKAGKADPGVTATSSVDTYDSTLSYYVDKSLCDGASITAYVFTDAKSGTDPSKITASQITQTLVTQYEQSSRPSWKMGMQKNDDGSWYASIRDQDIPTVNANADWGGAGNFGFGQGGTVEDDSAISSSVRREQVIARITASVINLSNDALNIKSGSAPIIPEFQPFDPQASK